jgi:hypothetical protein
MLQTDRQTLRGYGKALLGTAPNKNALRCNRTFPQETANVCVYETLQNDILTAGEWGGGGVQFAWRRFATHLIQSNDPVVIQQDGRRRFEMLMRSLLLPIITRILLLNVFLQRRHELVIQYKPNYRLTYLLRELSPSSEAANCATIQKIPSKYLRNTKIHHRVHKSPPLACILSQIDPLHTIPSYLSKIYFNIVRPSTSWSS